MAALLILGGKGEQKSSNTSSVDQEFSIQYLSENETESIYFAFLDMLYDLYFVSQQTSTDSSDDMVTFMSEIMKANSRLDDVIFRANKYPTHPNQIIELAGKGVIAGSIKIKEANTNFLTYLRGLGNFENFDTSEMSYQLAAYRAAEHEGYKLVIISTGQLASLTFKPAASENPTGLIPYTINKEVRTRILSRINDLFGERFIKDDKFYKETTNRNAVLLVVRSLRDNLTPDTYEEALN